MSLDAIPEEHLPELLADWQIEESWNKQARDLLAEITCADHKYVGRLGQVLKAQHSFFVGSEPIWRVSSGQLLSGGEKKLGLLVMIDSALIEVPEGCYQLWEKARLREEDGIEVVDDKGRQGILLNWRIREESRAGEYGHYKVRFGQEEVEVADWTMRQDPIKEFRRRAITGEVQEST